MTLTEDFMDFSYWWIGMRHKYGFKSQATFVMSSLRLPADEQEMVRIGPIILKIVDISEDYKQGFSDGVNAARAADAVRNKPQKQGGTQDV